MKFTEELGRFSDIKSLALKKASKKPSKWQIKHISKKKDTVEVEEEEEEEKEEEKNDEEDASGGLLETDDEREQRRRKGSGHRAAVSKQRFRKLHCPERYRPMFYPGTRLQLQCTDGVDRIQSEEDPGEKSDDCPSLF